jgi:pyruvate/2-oxoglutarate dehydrogenase complex dihydrolipoamide dehydrogenase (E3) component
MTDDVSTLEPPARPPEPSQLDVMAELPAEPVGEPELVADDAIVSGPIDVVVIGAGPTGENVADRTAAAGLTTVIVEAALLGGECSYSACIPSKAMLRGPIAVAAARSIDGARQAVTGDVDAAATFARRSRLTSNDDDSGQQTWVADAGIHLIRGTARITGEREVTVERSDGGTVVLRPGVAVVVCTGTTPAIPAIDGLIDAQPWTNRQATHTDTAPRRLVVLGGGPVGCELATAFRMLGSETVTLVERGPRVLGRLDAIAGDAVRAGMQSLGIDVRTGTQTTSVARADNGVVSVEMSSSGDGAARIEADEIIVALGRQPATTGLGLELLGLEPGTSLAADDTGLVHGVDGRWLYAAGDVTGAVLLTHIGKYQARACGDAIVERARHGVDLDFEPWSKQMATAQHDAVPQVVFTMPEVAAVGLSADQARERGMTVRVVAHTIDVAGANLHADDYTGTAQLVIDSDRDVVVGALFVGPDVGELLHAATVAVVGEVPIDRLWHAVPSFPTISEVWLRLLESYGC